MYRLGIYSTYQNVGYRQTQALTHQSPSHPIHHNHASERHSDGGNRLELPCLTLFSHRRPAVGSPHHSSLSLSSTSTVRISTLYIHSDDNATWHLQIGIILLVQSTLLQRNCHCTFSVVTTHPPAPPASSPTSHPPRGNFAPLRAQFIKNRGTLTPISGACQSIPKEGGMILPGVDFCVWVIFNWEGTFQTSSRTIAFPRAIAVGDYPTGEGILHPLIR